MKQKTKKILKILFIIFIILLLLELVFTTRVSFATEGEQAGGTNPIDVVNGAVDGVVGMFLNVLNILPVSIGGAIQLLAGRVASIGAPGLRIWFLNDGEYTI